jgi:hypothetical protein
MACYEAGLLIVTDDGQIIQQNWTMDEKNFLALSEEMSRKFGSPVRELIIDKDKMDAAADRFLADGGVTAMM